MILWYIIPSPSFLNPSSPYLFLQILTQPLQKPELAPPQEKSNLLHRFREFDPVSIYSSSLHRTRYFLASWQIGEIARGHCEVVGVSVVALWVFWVSSRSSYP